MTNDYEMADDNRADLIYGKEKLLAPAAAGHGGAAAPHGPGSTDEDYYRGNITADGLDHAEGIGSSDQPSSRCWPPRPRTAPRRPRR